MSEIPLTVTLIGGICRTVLPKSGQYSVVISHDGAECDCGYFRKSIQFHVSDFKLMFPQFDPKNMYEVLYLWDYLMKKHVLLELIPLEDSSIEKL